MIFPWILIGVILLGVQAAFAQDAVRVRSGEHPSFSRLVFYYPESIPWSLNRGPEGYVLRTERDAFAYQTEDVFKFLPRTRLEDIGSTTTSVDLSVSCDCHANAFEYRPGILVVDIKDGPAPEDSRFERRFDEPDPTPQLTGEPVLMLSELRWRSDANPTQAPVAAGAPVALPSLSDMALRSTFGEPKPDAGRQLGLPPSADLSALRSSLSRHLATAVSGGLLVTNDVESETPTGDQAGTVAESDLTASPPAAANLARLNGPAAPEAQLGLGFLEAGGARVDPQSSTCHPEPWFALALADGETASEALSRARGGLMEDLERPDMDAVLEFARVHVALGFGAEALNILDVYAAASDEAQVLRNMARIVDWPGRAAAPGLVSQADCEGDGALWGLLAHGSQTPRRPVDDQAVLRSLSAMPLDLRTHLTPAVSEKLRDIGLEESARAARDTVLRAVEQPDPGLVLEIAKTEAVPEESSIPDRIVPELEAASASTSTQAPLATAELIRRLSARRTEIDRKLLDEAAAQIFAYKGTPESAALFLRYVDALSRSGAYEEAVSYLEQMARSDFASDYDLPLALSSLMISLSESASDGTFLLIAGSQFDEGLPAVPSQAALKSMSVRLAQLGFRDEAIALLPEEDQQLRDGRSVVLAEAALAQDEPMEALARVASVASDEARRIRARALARLGAHSEAAAIYTALEEAESAADALWLASDWYKVHEMLEDPTRREIARRLREASPDPDATGALTSDADVANAAGVIPANGVVPDTSGVETLQDRVNLLDDSAELRALLAEISQDS